MDLIVKLSLILWCFIAAAVITFPHSQPVWGHSVIIVLMSFIIVPVFANTVDHLYQLNQGPDLLIYLLCLVWAADVGAYLMGRRLALIN